MKKIILFFFCILSIDKAYAIHIRDITEQSQVKYKWYKEEIVDELYYPKKDKLDGYFEDITNIKYGKYTPWHQAYCTYSDADYVIETKPKYVYECVQSSKYIKLENISIEDINEIKIFYKNILLDYEIIESTGEIIKIELQKSYEVDNIWFYIITDKEYDIRLSDYKDFSPETLSKHIENEKILIPDETWITTKTKYSKKYTEKELEETVFTKLKKIETICRAIEIETYRYKINKVYYDENYYTFIENYLPDKEDYVVEYIGELPKETVTITKTVKDKEIKKEYIYIDNSKNKENEQSKLEPEKKDFEKKEPEVIIETKHIEEIIKEKPMIPKKIYLLLTILLLLTIIEMIIIIKKKVEKNN